MSVDAPIDVAIVGAGLAGLACATILLQRGLTVKLFEQSDAIGGRIRTDNVDGFLLDRGFQVLLTAYPEVHKLMDINALQLHHFDPGAMVRYNNHFYRVDDPLRAPLQALPTALSPIGSLWDKLNILPLRARVTSISLEKLLSKPETTTLEALVKSGFSPSMIEPFFRPFLGGIFLDASLKTSSRMFDFVFRMFSQGYAALPNKGMQALPQQLARKISTDNIMLNCTVTSVSPTGLTLASGETISARAVVIATEASAATKLAPALKVPPSRSVGCFYYAADQAPVSAPTLILNGTGSGLVNNMCVPSLIAPHYAPVGKHLISVSVLNIQSEAALAETSEKVIAELSVWFGAIVKTWQPLRHYFIPHALPAFQPDEYPLESYPVSTSEGLFICGDYRENPSINGALASGRKAAEAILTALKIYRPA